MSEDRDYIELLRWALPRFGLRWEGFKNFRRQVSRRIAARIRELGLADVASYRRRVESEPDEERVLYSFAYVTISRFFRDRRVWTDLRERILPDLAALARLRGDRQIRVFSAGCASGEEPYSVAVLWHVVLAAAHPDVGLSVLATDFDEAVLARAARGRYEHGSLREVPPELRDAAFVVEGKEYVLRDEVRRYVTFERRDLRSFVPLPPLHLVLCRNSVFTYFDEDAQRDFAAKVAGVLVPGGVVIVGSHERLPPELTAFRPSGAAGGA